jgi:hypothetical protein
VTANCPDVQAFGVPATAAGDDKTGVDDTTPAGADDNTGSPAVDANGDVTEGAAEVGTKGFAEPEGADKALGGAAVHPASSATPTTNAGQPAIRTTPPLITTQTSGNREPLHQIRVQPCPRWRTRIARRGGDYRRARRGK